MLCSLPITAGTEWQIIFSSQLIQSYLNFFKRFYNGCVDTIVKLIFNVLHEFNTYVPFFIVAFVGTFGLMRLISSSREMYSWLLLENLFAKFMQICILQLSPMTVWKKRKTTSKCTVNTHFMYGLFLMCHSVSANLCISFSAILF